MAMDVPLVTQDADHEDIPGLRLIRVRPAAGQLVPHGVAPRRAVRPGADL